ncbi:uncharacterized protein [Rutidosis leptorrhynchoides]|uniref:uncharacterized protein n=1 Tax=Rutidosis leptorrhynchoides TaxID=125765 RepID=UPI003A99E569
MGNCSYKGFDTRLDPIRVMKPTGQILAFNAPKSVSEIVKNHPGHGIFRKDQLLLPLNNDVLLTGDQIYYLFPLASDDRAQKTLGHLEPVGFETEPVRMSTSAVALQLVAKNLSDGSGFEVLPAPRKGVWKVKLVIDTKQLGDILSEEGNTEALIEQMRVAAASSLKTVPRRSTSYWGVKVKPIFCNVMNRMVTDDSSSPKSVTSWLLQQQLK